MKSKVFIILLPLFLVVNLLVAAGFYGQDIYDTIRADNAASLKVQFPEPVIIEEGEYSRLSMEGLIDTGEPGEPLLPIREGSILLPSEFQTESMKIRNRSGSR